MRAIVNSPGESDPVTFDEVPEPTPAPDEVLLRVHAFSVNRGELTLLQRRAAGWRPGQDVAGTVVAAAADGSGPAVGSRVAAIVEDSGWSELVAARTSRLAVLPDDITTEQAAALPMAGLTALRTLRLGGDVLGKRVLVTGANGGVGRFQVELAAAAGAVVTAVTTRTDVEDELLNLGAHVVVQAAEKGDGPFDLVLESVGGQSLADALAEAAPGATLVVLGNSSGEPTPISVYDFFGHEGARLVNYMSYAAAQPDDRDLAILVNLVSTQRLTPTFSAIVDWNDIAATLPQFGDRTLTGGKLVAKLVED